MGEQAQWDTRRVKEIIGSMKDAPGALLPMLHAMRIVIQGEPVERIKHLSIQRAAE